MSVVSVLDAERVKLATTRSPLWSALGVAVLGLGVAALQGWSAQHYTALPPGKAALGVAVFGVPVLMVLSSMTVTGEYRTGLIRTTFLATPHRTLVLIAKAVVCAAFSSVCAVVMVLVSVVVARLVAAPTVGEQLSLGNPAVWQVAGGFALYAALAAVLGVAVGALVRFAAGAVAVLLLWPLVAEPLLGNLPGKGAAIGPWLPFANMFRFLDVEWLFAPYAMHWGEVGSLVYFVVMVAVVFVAAVVVLNNRDAGMSLEENFDWVEKNKGRFCHWFTVADLNHLKRGGRVSAAAAFLGTMLSIKPVLHVDDEGRLIPMEKAKGRAKSIRALLEHMKATAIEPEKQVIFISHGDAPEEAEGLAQMVRDTFGCKEVRVGNIGPVIGAHSGPGTIALFFVGSPR